MFCLKFIKIHSEKGASQTSSEQMMGLKPFVCLSRGARVITSNYWQQMGIVNNALGTIRHIIFEEGSAPPTLPSCVVVEMDEPYRGPHLEGKPRF